MDNRIVSMKSKVLIIEDSSKARFGGGQRISLSVIQALSHSSLIFLADTDQRRGPSLFVKKAMPYTESFIGLKSYGKVGSRAVSSYNLSILEVLLYPFFLIANIVLLKKALKGVGKRDLIVYAATKKALIYAYLLRLLFGYRYIYHAHSPESNNPTVRRLMRTFYNKAEQVICVSNFVKNQISTPNAQVIYNSVESVGKDSKIRTIEDKAEIVAASFSSLQKLKGIDVFMGSYAFLEQKIRKIIYRIYGEGSELNKLKHYELENVRLMGFAEDVHAEMKNIDILVVSSRTEETFGLTALEAMHLGIPVIVTNIGGQAEVVPDGVAGIHVRPGNQEDIAKAIDLLITEEGLYQQLSRGAVLTAENFSREVFNDKIRGAFQGYLS